MTVDWRATPCGAIGGAYTLILWPHRPAYGLIVTAVAIGLAIRLLVEQTWCAWIERDTLDVAGWDLGFGMGVLTAVLVAVNDGWWLSRLALAVVFGLACWFASYAVCWALHDPEEDTNA